ncbi:hypothetical protein NLX71_25385 [Paenibacillus sp. MZ04-78.2]|uniref:hypothetical protein n=1 Tax=Paenibacillus sp. MZ04-78.2 TaxID=2962034 RepID=UPI0020B8E5DD|nr:hypothetical protein [Paenibacillus sp. MZ04-78.2]MCP3776582.1 hypothetical protein [Paenibacillus sp. MZ04-78.2]
MKKYLGQSVLIALVITNVVTLFMYFNKDVQNGYAQAQPTVKVSLFSGQGEHWKLDNYTIVKTNTSIWRGNGKLTYLGSLNEIKDSNYFKYSFYEKHGEKKEKLVLEGLKKSNNGNIDILENLKVGSIEGPVEEMDKNQGSVRYYLEIEWVNNEGVSKKEEIPLELT